MAGVQKPATHRLPAFKGPSVCVALQSATGIVSRATKEVSPTSAGSLSTFRNNVTTSLRLRPLSSTYFPKPILRTDLWNAVQNETCGKAFEKHEEKNRKNEFRIITEKNSWGQAQKKMKFVEEEDPE